MNLKSYYECESKKAYKTKEQAIKQAKIAKKRGYTLHEYKCPTCNNWHIGHQSKPIQWRVTCFI